MDSTDLEQLTDSQIVELARNGNKEAFGVLYQRYVQRIYSYVYYRVGNAQEAEDLTGRVFLKAWQHIERYEERGLPFTAYLYRIAHNLVANWHRDQSRRKEIPIDDTAWQLRSSADQHPERQLLEQERQEQLLAIIRKLPPERQELLILKFVERLSNAEIGQIMGRTEGAIKSLYHRTLIALRAELAKLEEEEQQPKQEHRR